MLLQYFFSHLGKHLYCFKSSASANIFLGLETMKSYFWKQLLLIKRKIRNILIGLKTNAYGITVMWFTDIKCYLFLTRLMQIFCVYKYISDIWHHNNIIPFNKIRTKVGYSVSELFEYNVIRSAVRAHATCVGLGAVPTPTTLN